MDYAQVVKFSVFFYLFFFMHNILVIFIKDKLL